MNTLLRRTCLAASIGALALLAACSDDDADADGEEPTAAPESTATAAPTVAVPEGWSAFSEPEYSGFARDGWVFQTLDASMFAGDTSTILPDMPAETRDLVVQALSTQDLSNVLYVYVDPGNLQLTSNINVLTCGEAAGISLDSDSFMEAYAQNNVEAEIHTTLNVMGDETSAYRVHINPTIDTYQVPFRAGGDCESIATLGVLPGEDHHVEDFITFMEGLQLSN